MSDCITPIINILNCLCSYCAKWKDSMDKLEEDLISLRNASNELNDMYLDVQKKVETAEQDPDPELVVLNEVKGWMGRVNDILQQKDIKAILDQETAQQDPSQEAQACCFGSCCAKNCWACCKLQKVTQKLREVNALISGGHFDVVAQKFALDRFEELPVEKAVGIESTLKKLCSCFDNNRVRIIGLYGMGGVGKTTLLKTFNNEFLSRKVGCVVIWVEATKDADPEIIQDAIRKKLRVQDDAWNNKTMDERARLLCNILNKKKFVLLLDNVWKRIDLVKLGIPSSNNHEYKIIFTTRSSQVCGLMEAQRYIEVGCLTPDKALHLFKEKVGETIFDENPHILSFAKKVVEKCQYLPLALCTVGRAMANKGIDATDPDEWRNTLENLKSYPSDVPGIVEDLYPSLKFSYDGLPNDAHKACFLYCALFPEGYNIEQEDIILLWMSEGFLAEFDEASKQGKNIISNLKYASLLENGEKENTVKMHDVIRAMALWVACDDGKITRLIVRDDPESSGLPVFNHAIWNEVKMLSLWGRIEMITNFTQKPHCPNLATLLIRKTSINVFPTEVFVLTSTIKVLDLSFNKGISNLPSTIGDFVNLEHMNLSSTNIKYLPQELKNLKKLRFLLLDGLVDLQFPNGVISSLLSLQAFSMRYEGLPKIDENVLLQELEGLYLLQDIRISIFSKSSIIKILNSSKLQRCMCDLFVQRSFLLDHLFTSIRKMGRLQTLGIEGIPENWADPEGYEAVNIPRGSFREHEYKIVLRKLILWNCHDTTELNWLIHTQNLEVLELVNCDSLVEIISEGIMSSDLFCSLTNLQLRKLRNLRSICSMTLQLPYVKEIQVTDCPKLKKPSFNSQSAFKTLLRFTGDLKLFNQSNAMDKPSHQTSSSINI